MQLPGCLKGTTLGDVLGTLHRARATGVLELIETGGPTAGRSHRIRLDRGLVSDVDTAAPGPRLAELLQQRGDLPGGDPSRIAAAARATAQPTGKLLLERRLVSAEQISRALHEQVRRRLEALFRIEDAQVRFHVPRPRQRDATEPDPLGPGEFLHGRPRRRGTGAASARRGSLLAGSLRVLGLPPEATLADVRRAFRQLAAAHHPDRFPQASEAERRQKLQRLSELTSAYHVLLRSELAAGA